MSISWVAAESLALTEPGIGWLWDSALKGGASPPPGIFFCPGCIYTKACDVYTIKGDMPPGNLVSKGPLIEGRS